MTAKEIFQKEHIFFGEENINGILCSVGYIKKFKLSWLATQLNTFIIIGKTNEKITSDTIENFSDSCLKYALRNNKGWPRGLQSGVGAIAILQGTDIDNDAVAYCHKLSKKHWSAFEIPVIYNLEKQQTIRFSNSPIWGLLYFPYFINTIDKITSQLTD